MSDFLKEMSVWKMALLKAFLLCCLAGCNNFQSAMDGVEWEDLTPTQIAKLANGMFIAIAGAMVAFLDKSMQRISEGKSPLETGGTSFVSKAVVGLLILAAAWAFVFSP